MAGLHNGDVANEERIVWLLDVEQYPWVRESATNFSSRKNISNARRQSIEEGGQILVGYATLSDEAPPAKEIPKGSKPYFWRRIFTLRKTDYEAYRNAQGLPVESVITESLYPKAKGIRPQP